MERWTPIHLDGHDVLVIPGTALLSTHPAEVAWIIDDALGHPEGRAALAAWLSVSEERLDDPEIRASAAQLLRMRHWVAIEIGTVDVPRASKRPELLADWDSTAPLSDIRRDRERQERARERGWVSIEVLGHTGVPYGGLQVTMVHGDERRDRVVLDEHGRHTARDVPKAGRTIVTFPPLLELPAHAGRGPVLDGFQPSPTDLRIPRSPRGPDGPSLQLGQMDRHYRVVVDPPTAAAVMFDTGGLCFCSDRETFVPTRIDALDGGPNYHFLTGIDALRHVVEHARAHPEERVCVIGHSDTVGGTASNVELSARRAWTVQLFLAGQRDAWAALAVENQTVADWQAFLQWAHLVMGMNCNPGEVDDDLGQATQGALHRFRAAYNARYGGSLAIEGPFVAEDWKAAFDCYRKNLAEQMGESLTSIESVLAAVRFGEPATLACGERFPAEYPGADDRESARNRRVDIVFYETEDRPDFDAQPPGVAIYGEDGCARRYELIAASPFAMVRFCVQDANGAPQAGSVCSLILDGQVTQATSAADGYVEFRVPARARTATLLVQDASGKGQERHIMLGGLQAVDDDAGVEGRLRNLGFDTGPAGKQPDALAKALSGFQQRCSLDQSGTADDDTRERLVQEHGC